MTETPLPYGAQSEAVAWLPCPFCGCDHADNATNAPFPSRAFGAPARYWTARCGNPSCGADVEGETEQDTLNRWNRRPATIPLTAVEALVADYDDGKLQAPGFVQAIRALQALTKGAAR